MALIYRAYSPADLPAMQALARRYPADHLHSIDSVFESKKWNHRPGCRR